MDTSSTCIPARGSPADRTGRPADAPAAIRDTPGAKIFQFYRFRFHFRTIDALHFSAGKSSNLLRGSFGRFLSETAPPACYARLFQPGKELAKTPAGLADWPRPFLLRAAHLDGLTIPTGCGFYFDLHSFEMPEPPLAALRDAFSRIAVEGLGPGRGRAVMERVEELDLGDHASPSGREPGAPCTIVLDHTQPSVGRVRLRFETPTELKERGRISDRPEFVVLFGRLRDRISTLRALYGEGPLEMDFRGMGERANAIRLAHCDLQWRHVERKSSRTGQSHPLGGFTGTADYEGPLAEFMPWLYAARWVGVGRQTVWGKGDVRVLPG